MHRKGGGHYEECIIDGNRKRASLNGMDHSEKPSIGNTIDAQELK